MLSTLPHLCGLRSKSTPGNGRSSGKRLTGSSNRRSFPTSFKRGSSRCSSAGRKPTETGMRARIAAPNDFSANWVRDHHLKTLEDAFAQVTGAPCEVLLVIDEQTAAMSELGSPLAPRRSQASGVPRSSALPGDAVVTAGAPGTGGGHRASRGDRARRRPRRSSSRATRSIASSSARAISSRTLRRSPSPSSRGGSTIRSFSTARRDWAKRIFCTRSATI